MSLERGLESVAGERDQNGNSWLSKGQKRSVRQCLLERKKCSVLWLGRWERGNIKMVTPRGWGKSLGVCRKEKDGRTDGAHLSLWPQKALGSLLILMLPLGLDSLKIDRWTSYKLWVRSEASPRQVHPAGWSFQKSFLRLLLPWVSLSWAPLVFKTRCLEAHISGVDFESWGAGCGAQTFYPCSEKPLMGVCTLEVGFMTRLHLSFSYPLWCAFSS